MANGDGTTTLARSVIIVVLTASLTANVTMIGAWATHSVSRDELHQAIQTHSEITAGEIKVLRNQLETVTENQKKVIEKLDDLKIQVERQRR